jgi:hypothetical protein
LFCLYNEFQFHEFIQWLKPQFLFPEVNVMPNDIITITILDIINRPVFYSKQLFGNWILSVSHPEIEIRWVDWAKQSRYHLETEREFSLRNTMFKKKREYDV